MCDKRHIPGLMTLMIYSTRSVISAQFWGQLWTYSMVAGSMGSTQLPLMNNLEVNVYGTYCVGTRKD